jgi:para-aminobenzoate synthetase component 1
MDRIRLKGKFSASRLFRLIRKQHGNSALWMNQAGDGESFMAFQPSAQLTVRQDGRTQIRRGHLSSDFSEHPLELISEFVREGSVADEMPTAPPRTFGFLAFDFASRIEARLACGTAIDDPLPLAYFAQFACVLVCQRNPGSAEDACTVTAFGTNISPVVADLEAALRAESPAQDPPPRSFESDLCEWPDKAQYLAAVSRALDYIAAGDIYQMNLASRFVAESTLTGLEVFERLQQAQPVPFGVYFAAPEFELLSNSPERFLRVRGDTIVTEPIKGTRPRSLDKSRDRALAEELRNDPKERAENIMVVDLERNDLGRICARGSVEVPSLLRVESWATVHHLVSTVQGQLRPDANLAAILRATFPGGSITGTPKIRATEIIAELEEQPREIFTGSFFAFRTPRDFDSSILIRTAWARGGRFTYHAGCGIVADSIPENEYEEMWIKAEAFLRAIDIKVAKPASGAHS